MFENISKGFSFESFDFDFEAEDENHGKLEIELEKLRADIIDNLVSRNRQFQVSRYFVEFFVFMSLHNCKKA